MQKPAGKTSVFPAGFCLVESKVFACPFQKEGEGRRPSSRIAECETERYASRLRQYPKRPPADVPATPEKIQAPFGDTNFSKNCNILKLSVVYQSEPPKKGQKNFQPERKMTDEKIDCDRTLRRDGSAFRLLWKRHEEHSLLWRTYGERPNRQSLYRL